MTYREQFDSAMKCNTLEEAKAWLASEIERYRFMPEFKSDECSERTIKINLGYMAGYYGAEEAEKVHRLFGAVHPIFGTATYHNDVTLEAAFEAGRTVGRIAKGRSVK